MEDVRMFYDFSGVDVVQIARDMIGMELFTQTIEGITSGVITETEAYSGISDRASHAWKGLRTTRNEPMYAEGGTVYIYLCYGIHSMFNIVTNKVGVPDAVLVRAIQPKYGIELILHRLKKQQLKNNELYGPGNVTKALGLHYSQSGVRLNDFSTDGSIKIWMGKGETPIDRKNILINSRIGIDYAGEDALRPYRFTKK